jgi:SH3 domain-containing YSC84-like protein 1
MGYFLSEAIMGKITGLKTGLSLIWMCALLAACASPQTENDTVSRVREAEATLANFKKDPDMTWMQNNLPKAKGILISPNIFQAGFIVGGSGGAGVLIARDKSAQGWTSPAFYKLATGNIGLQIGAQTSEMVALVMTDKAMDSLLSSSFKLGGDVSIAAGPVGSGAGVPIMADMYTFVRSKGLYGGLNLDGTVISVDDEGNRAFYGRSVSPIDILVKHNAKSPEGERLARVASAPVPSLGVSGTGSSATGSK